MRKLTLLLLAGFVCISSGLFAQLQGIQWKKIIGTEYNEVFDKMIAASDDGFLVIGSRQVPIAANPDNDDMLLMKVNKVGAVEWEKLYGGSGDDWGNTGIVTADGGYIIIGGTSSIANDGDVTGHHGFDTTDYTMYPKDHVQDLWVLKINATGDIIWKHAFGGSRMDGGKKIIKTADNNYVISGYTASWDGDVTGIRRSNVDPATTENADAWVVKIDDNGNLLWQKCFGGNESDWFHDIIAVSNGFMIAGETSSDDLDVSNGVHYWSHDAWIVNIDATGNIVWEKTYGGSNSDGAKMIMPVEDGYIIGAETYSVDSDVAGRKDSLYQDIWIFGIDFTGNLLWNKFIGEKIEESLTGMHMQPDKSIMISGIVGMEFTDSFRYPMIVKLDAAHNIVFDNRYPVLNGTEVRSIATLDNLEYYIAGMVNGTRYKMMIPEDHLYGGFTDGVIIKFGNVNTITGKVFLDINANHIFDTGEPLLQNVRVTSSKGDGNYSSFSLNGIYANSVYTGEYITSAQYPNPNYAITPTSATSQFNSYFNTDTIDFAVTPVPGKNDLSTVVFPLTPARPGFEATYRIKIYNNGTTILDPVIKFVKDSRLSVISSTPAATAVEKDTLSWQITGFNPFDTATLDVRLQLAPPPSINNGDSLLFRVLATPVTNEETPLNNADTLNQRVVGSFDPNDKTETHGGVISPAQISGADPLTYLIRFQNMGTDTAFNIIVRDTLDNRLDLNSFEMIDAGHSYQLTIEDDKLTWFFNNIKLPDHNINEPASHGYLAYRIKPKPTVLIGDTIRNDAGIYFDFNLPVQTNTNKTVVLSLVPTPLTLVSFRAALNGDMVDVKWKTADEYGLSHFEIQRSANGIDFASIGTAQPGHTPYMFKDREPLTGYNYYRLKSVDIDGSIHYSPVSMVNVSNENTIITAVYPNPGNGQTVYVKLRGSIQGTVRIQVLDQLGRPLFTKQYNQQNAGDFKTELNLGKLSKGSYILKVMANEKAVVNTILIQ